MPAERHDLVNLLADCYPDTASSQRLVVGVGLDPKLIGVHAIPTDTWFSIVENAERNDKLDDLLDLACQEFPALRAKLPAKRRPARLENLPARRLFVGRKDELAALEQALEWHGRATIA